MIMSGRKLLSRSRTDPTCSQGRESAVLRKMTNLSTIVADHRPTLNSFIELVPRTRGNVVSRIDNVVSFVVAVIDSPIHVSRNGRLRWTDSSDVTNTTTAVANLTS